MNSSNIFFAILTFNLIVHINCFTHEEALQHIQECLDELKITLKEYMQMKKDKSTDSYCVVACIMKKRESLIDGKINPENMLINLKKMNFPNRYLDEDELKKCSEIANAQTTECLVVREIMNCLFYKQSLDKTYETPKAIT